MVAIRRPEMPIYLILRQQEIPYDHSHSRFMLDKNFVATRKAFHFFGHEVLFAGLLRIQAEADRRHGLDYLQIFEYLDKICHDGQPLWFIEDSVAVSALLPEDY